MREPQDVDGSFAVDSAIDAEAGSGARMRRDPTNPYLSHGLQRWIFNAEDPYV
jgi:hypothetical protein